MSLRTPPLRSVHEDRGAQFTDFGGWEMPVEFDSITEEHAAVRERAGKFDVSHMGEIEVEGPDAADLLGRLTTNDPASLDPGGSQYAAITDEAGVILDDTVIYRRGETSFLFVPNAGHDEEMADRFEAHRGEWGLDAEVHNATSEYGMIAIQGPEAVEHLGAETETNLADLPRFEAAETTVAGVDALLARTGYTGEDGFECILPWKGTPEVWDALDAQPCGLGSRDTLRLEMGFLLSGQDFHPEENPRNPFEADIGFAVDLETEFVGAAALRRVASDGVAERLTGFELLDRGVPRRGYEIRSPGGESIGEVTSGTMSPTLSVPIGLGYLPVEYTEPGTEIAIVVRGEPKTARVRATPFTDR